MSLYKRIWIEQDPAYADFRQQIAGDPAEIIPRYPFGVPLRRRNRLSTSPHWDPLWRGRVASAVENLKFDHIVVNSRMMFRTREERDAALQLAEKLWADELERRGKPLR